MADRKTSQRQQGGGSEESMSLRQRAMDLLDKNTRQVAQIPEWELKPLLHELQVHQIELEMQNQELRESRQELERMQAEYASLYDHAPVGYLSLDPAGLIRRLNLKAAEILGQERGRLIGAHLAGFISADDRPVFLRESRQAIDSGKHHICELRLQPPGGNVAHIHFECQLAAIEAVPQELRITMTDISERVRADERLRISRRQLEAALDASRCGLWDWPDVDRDEAWWSPEFYSLLGYENGAIRPGYRAFKSLLHPDDRDRVVRTLEEHIRRRTPYDLEFRLRSRRGDYRWFRGDGRMLRSGPHNRHMAGLLQDITSQRQTKEKLREAKARAESADREKSRFLAAASHDLRQPLQSLSLYLGALKQMERTAKSNEIIDKMRQSILTMGQLLRTLLNVSRLDAGIISPEPAAFPVMELFNEILINHGPSARASGLALRTHPSALVVVSDRVLLQEIIQNFVSNALQNTDSGGVLLGCRRRGERAWIQVWDTGIGITPDRLPVLLNPPAATDTTTAQGRTEETIRSGLGLAIVRQIAGLLDYRVDAHSVPNLGSMFAVEVPLADTASASPAIHAPSAGQSNRNDGLTLLLVDNNTAILDAYRTVAGAGGYRIECANSRDEVLALLQRGLEPDIIISDLRLRRVPGTTVIRHVREKLGKDVPAILLTGDTASLDAEVSSLGGCRVLYKPVEFEVLTRTIEEMTGRG